MRSGAALQAQTEVRAQSPQKRLTKPDAYDISSSDDDEEDIPFASSRKPTVDPKSIPLDHRRNRIKQPNLSRPTSSNQFKRRKIEQAANSRDVQPYPTPVSSVAALPVKATQEPSQRSPNTEDAVPAGQLNIVNAALKQSDQSDREEPEKPPESPTQQLLSEANAQNDENDQTDGAEPNQEITAPQELDDDEESLFVADDESERSFHPKNTVEEEGEVQRSPLENRNLDNVWDVPPSPQKSPSTQPDPATSLEGPPPRRRLISQRNPKPSWSSRANEAHINENTALTPQVDDDEFSEVHQLRTRLDAQQEEQDEAEGDYVPEHIDGLSTDDENLGDIDLSAEESFAQDVSNFKARHPRGYQGTETFESPLEKDDVAVHISFSDLKRTLKLMGHRAWARLKGQWYTRPFNYEQSEVSPVRALLQFLTKLERLLEEVPKAPRITEQNLFFREHSDLLGYYFSKIRLIIDHIRKQRLENLERSTDNTKGRDMMSQELISYAIPMLFHVMASTWRLGGVESLSPSFTICSIELLGKMLGCIELLYLPLLRGLRQELLDPEENEPKYRHKERLVIREKREALEPYLKELRRAIEAGIDKIAKEERLRDQERHDRRRNLERQKELQAQEIWEEEEMMRKIEEKQWRSLMSIRGVHIPLSESPIPSSATMSPMAQSPPPSRGIDDWTLEEQRLLTREIQMSYPNLPDLATICSDIDRTHQDVEAAAEELLGRMLKAVRPEADAADRAAEIKRMMNDYRLTYGA